MTGNDAILAVDDDWIEEAEFLDAGRDLGYLCIGMRAAVAGVWNEIGGLDGFIEWIFVCHVYRSTTKNRPAQDRAAMEINERSCPVTS